MRYPLLFLLVAIVLLPITHLKTVVFGLPLYPPEWAVLAATIVFCYHSIRSGVNPLKRLFSLDRLLLWGLGLFLGGAVLSFLVNPFSLHSLGIMKSWFFFPALFGLLLSAVLRETEYFEEVLFVWQSVLILVALYALPFFFSGELTYDGRLAGGYASPNFLAYFLAPAPLLGAYGLFRWAEEGKERVSLALFSAVGITLSLWVIFLTRSYGTWVALMCAFVIGALLLFFRQGGSRKLLIVLPILCLAGFLLLDQGSDKWHSLVEGDPRSSFASRMMIWRSALLMVEEHPLFGIGAGRFQSVYLEYQRFFSPYLEWAVPEPHNFFLALLLATGLLGTFGFLLLVIRLGVLLLRHRARKQECTALMVSLWMLFFVYGLVDTPYFKTDLAYIFFLVWALTAALIEKKTPSLREGVREASVDASRVRFGRVASSLDR